MPFSIVFLIYSCAFLSLLARKEDNKPCVFPFTYKKKTFSSCTTYGTLDEQLWCATTRNCKRNNNEWKWCATQEYGGNSGGQPCVFPFFYRKKVYYTCATKKFDKPWCATTGSYDKDKKWSYCADTRLSAEPMGPCIFPFVFEGKSHSTCVRDSSSDGKLFCSLTDNYDADLMKVPCADTENRRCIFPFRYNGKYYCLCTRDGTKGGPQWCATTKNYDKDKKWKICAPGAPKELETFSGCVFPFKYEGKSYWSCTKDGAYFGSLWCSLSHNYDGINWINCNHFCG